MITPDFSTVSKDPPKKAVVPEQMIVAVGNIKGGVGKTTLAVNFVISQALRGQDVLLVDGDEQGRTRRPAPPPISAKALR